jgi:hypothetical protein
MNDSHNSPHVSRYGHGDEHPRLRPTDADFLTYNQWRINQVGRFIDRLNTEEDAAAAESVVAEAWAVLHPISSDGPRTDPGE